MLSNLELHALLNSTFISLGVSFFSVLISLFLAFSLSFYKIPGKRLFSFLFLIPLLIPPYLHAFSWMHLLLFLENYNLSVIRHLNSLPGIIGILTLAYFPISLFIIHQAIKNIPQHLIDAALQVTNPVRVLKRIVFAAILPSTLTATLLTFIVTFITFDVPAYLGKNVFITQIFKSFTFTSEIPRALYLSVIPVFIVGSMWAILLLYLVKEKPFFSLQSFKKSVPFSIQQPRLLKILMLSLFVVLFLLSSILPIGILQVKNILYDKIPFYTASSFGVITNTFWISFISSICIVFFSTLIYIMFFRKMAGRIFFLSLLALPPITYGILFIYLFNHQSLNVIYATPIILIIAYCFRFAPLVSELLHTHTQQVNPQYLEAARLVYPPSLRMFHRIVIPLYKPVLFLAWVFSFWLVATELPITLLIQPPGFQTIITRLFIVLHYGAVELMSLMTVALLFVSLLPILAIYFFFHIDKKNDQ